MTGLSPTIVAAALQRAEQRLAQCRVLVSGSSNTRRMHSKYWKEVYIPRYEWQQAWVDYGRVVLTELYHQRGVE